MELRNTCIIWRSNVERSGWESAYQTLSQRTRYPCAATPSGLKYKGVAVHRGFGNPGLEAATPLGLTSIRYIQANPGRATEPIGYNLDGRERLRKRSADDGSEEIRPKLEMSFDSGLGVEEGVIKPIEYMTNVKAFSLPW